MFLAADAHLPAQDPIEGHAGGRADLDPTAIAGATLASIGITKDQSSRAQKLAEVPEDEFEARIAWGLIP